MIKNVVVKKVLKGSVFRIITLVNKVVPKDDKRILLYNGNKGVSFNNEEILNYLLENNYNSKYKILCAVEGKKYFGKNMPNVQYITQKVAIVEYMRTKHVFYTAGQLPIKPATDQIVIHMNHGVTDYKTMGTMTNISNGDEHFFTYMIASAPIYVPIEAKAYRCSEDDIKVTGEPMADRLLHPRKVYQYDNYKRVLLWAPTFRQSDYLGYDDSDYDNLIPLFENGKYDELNTKLKDAECLLIVKLHPSQTLNGWISGYYSNLKIYTHEDFVKDNINIYDLMASVDCLIGDYSSASLQYLLTDKPVAFVIPDIEDYKIKRGFVFENPTDYMPGHLIYTQQDFWDFLTELSMGIDNYSNQRKKIKNIIHQYKDGKSIERILELGKIEK